MLINYSVKNWMSFRDITEFSMIASKEKQHGERLAKVAKYKMRVLPASSIYGGNASGKTNFVKSLIFAKEYITNGRDIKRPIGAVPFFLKEESIQAAVEFCFQILIDEIIYDYSFSVKKDTVVSEKLTKITSASEKVMFDRTGEEITFSKDIGKDRFLEYTFRATRKNMLYITSSVSQNVEYFKFIYNWFSQNLVVITPYTKYYDFDCYFNEKSPIYERLSAKLSELDTGISHIGTEEVSLESANIPIYLREQMKEQLAKSGSSEIMAVNETNQDRLYITEKDGSLVVQRMVSYHPMESGDEMAFGVGLESDGTNRMMDILPAFISISEVNCEKVFVIDELDRSLHTLLTQMLLEGYMDSCDSSTRSQLIFTTHDALLMDQKLFRRDEMWVTERNNEGATSMIPFSDFEDIRYDKDIRKSYLLGRMGGIPNLTSGRL